MIKKLKSFFYKEEETMSCRTQGRVNIIGRNGGIVDVHPTVLLNSRQEGYHVGMPFETTLIADAPGALIRIGEGCRIHGAYIHAWDSIEIGRNVLIAAGTNIVDSNGHSADVKFARYRQFIKDEPRCIKIGDYVWIGMNAMILKGVEIGECSIVAAGAVVKVSVPPFTVVEGNPAKIIRKINSEECLPEGYPLEILAQEKGFYKY